MEIQLLEFDGTKIRDFLPKGMNMAQLAREVGVSRQAMHDIAKGRRKPSADLMVRLTAVLNVSVANLANKNFLQNKSANS